MVDNYIQLWVQYPTTSNQPANERNGLRAREELQTLCIEKSIRPIVLSQSEHVITKQQPPTWNLIVMDPVRSELHQPNS